MTSEIKKIFLSIIRLGIGHKGGNLPSAVDWQVIQSLAAEQGLEAIVVDGIAQMPEAKRPPRVLLLQWIGEVFQNYEKRYELYRRAISELAGWYNAHRYKMMVLKGYACGLDWPIAEHRPCGDIDIWIFGKQKEADALLTKEDSIIVDASHHHHTVFDWYGFPVENHYDFVNVHTNKSSAKLEKIFKRLGEDYSHYVEVEGETVYLPSANLHALFLIRHMVSHFAAADISLRQVLDWAFFVEKHTDEVDWDWLLPLLEKYHMKNFFNLINAICVEDLEFHVGLFPAVHYDSELKDRVLDDILNPEFNDVPPNRLLPRLWFRYSRWQANSWKQQLCYNESRWNLFWSGVWNHLLKPNSI